MKSVYGLKQAAFRWNEDVDRVLQKEGFEALDADTCVYTHKDSKGIVVCVIALHVDDMLLLADDETSQRVTKRLKANYTMTDSEARWFLKMKLRYSKDRRSVTISQPDYAEEIVKAAGVTDLKPLSTPLSDHLVKGTDIPVTDHEREIMATADYGGVVGMLAYYALMTRPDLAQAVGQAQRFCSAPRLHHWEAVQRMARYVAGTKNYGLRFYKGACEKVVGSSDSDWASDVDDRKSTSGYLFTLMGGAISWKSKKQPGRPARSSAEAELIALDQAVREALWLRKMCQGLSQSTSP